LWRIVGEMTGEEVVESQRRGEVLEGEGGRERKSREGEKCGERV
jgi:hypothetical protein